MKKTQITANGKPANGIGFYPGPGSSLAVKLFPNAFKSKSQNFLNSVLTHELGHVLGLRHEFVNNGDASLGISPEREKGLKIGQDNPLSIMGYRPGRGINDGDYSSIKTLYSFRKSSLQGGFKVKTFTVPPRDLQLVPCITATSTTLRSSAASSTSTSVYVQPTIDAAYCNSRKFVLCGVGCPATNEGSQWAWSCRQRSVCCDDGTRQYYACGLSEGYPCLYAQPGNPPNGKSLVNLWKFTL